MDLKLDSADQLRPEAALADFQLPDEVLRLIDQLDELIATKFESLEVRAGIPRRAVFRPAPLAFTNLQVGGNRRDTRAQRTKHYITLVDSYERGPDRPFRSWR
jgi:hypothetical protein